MYHTIMVYHMIINHRHSRENELAFTTVSSAKLCDTLGNSKVKNQDPWKFHLELLYLENPLEIPHHFWWGVVYDRPHTYSILFLQ